MHLYFRNCNDAFKSLCGGFRTGRFPIAGLSPDGTLIGADIAELDWEPPLSRRPTRYGQCIVIEEPVTITYTNPLERVLWNPYRDCNPFLHLIEALWVLAGSNDCKLLAHFAKRMMEFADEDLSRDDIPFGGTLNRVTVAGNPCTGSLWWGAYGYRYRHWFTADQLATAIAILANDPTTRRVVLQAWEPRDLERVNTRPSCKDVPCNTEILFMPRPGPASGLHGTQLAPPKKRGVGNVDDLQANTHHTLDMTVINRSNDMLWGALGSNYVVFSVLHEYIALSAGYAVGRYNQFSNNLHVYSDTVKDGESKGKQLWSNKWEPAELDRHHLDEYDTSYNHFPLFNAPLADREALRRNQGLLITDCMKLFSAPGYVADDSPSRLSNEFSSPFFQDVVVPMIAAFNLHKKRDYRLAKITINRCFATDWRQACLGWLQRRQHNHENKRRAQDDGPYAVAQT